MFQKIAPYVPRTLSINSFHNHKDLLRKGSSKVVQINLAETVRFYQFPSSPEQSYPIKLIKLLRRIKGLKRLSFDQNILNKCRFKLSTMMSLRKKVRRIQELTVNEFWTPGLFFRTRLNVWMKSIKNLRKVTFKLEIFRKDVYQKNSFSNRMKSFLKTLKYQNQMKSLKIQLPQEVSFANPIFLQFSKYPQSLQNLQLLFRTQSLYATEVKPPCLSLSCLKNLKTFALKITDDHEIVRHLVDTLPSLPHLKSLGVILPTSFVIPKPNQLYGPHCHDLDSQVFSSLRDLSLTVPSEYLQTPLLAKLNLSNLESLHLSFRLLISSKYKATLSNLSKIKRLKNLKLAITYLIHLEELTKALFESLVDLEMLTSLKIFLVTSDSNRFKDDISSDALPALKKIFQKSARMEKFSLECKELVISLEFFELMEIFSGASASNLKKFKLDTVPFAIGEKKIEALAGFVKSLENVRTLKIPCFDIDSNELLASLVSGIMKSKAMRSICLGKIGWKVKERNFIENIESILEKRGLQILKCELTDDFKKRLGSVGSPLSFEKISKKNPLLKFVGENTWGMFKENNW